MKTKLQDKAQGVFQEWRVKTTIRKGDSLLSILKKISLLLAGIVVMIAFSPFLLLVFLIVLLAAL